MVKVDTDLFEKIWGSIADQFSYKTYDGKRGMILEIKPELPYTRSEAQDVVRKEFVIAKNRWLDASEEEREKYRDYALRHNLTLYQAWMANEINVEFGVSDKEAILTGKGIEQDVLPQKEEIIRYYAFDEGSGDTLKDYAEGEDGTIEGASWVDGYDGFGGLSFDGLDDWVNVPIIKDLNEATVISLSVHNSINDGKTEMNYRDRFNQLISLSDDGGGNLKFASYGSDYTDTITTFPSGGYNLLHGQVVDNGYIYVGFNGENKNTTPIGSLAMEKKDTHALGSCDPDDSSYYLDGEISLFLLYDVKLSGSELMDIANKLELT